MKSPKIIAHYLPQFYDISENNKWWWDWFTEWTNVKKAEPLFKNHLQPRIPLNENYYTTLDKETRKWQAETAKKYWIDGFCYYHYWFEWWKLLLEKPMELFLEDWEPNIPFCFSWGNWNWARTWEGQPEEILMKQEYWYKEDWKKHFEYLLPFFKSDLYLKEDWKPVFLIHYSKHMSGILEDMIVYWDKLAKENGLKWIYITEVITSAQSKPYAKSSSAILEFEPLHTVKNWITMTTIPLIIKFALNRFSKRFTHKWIFTNTINYSYIWSIILKKQPEKNTNYTWKEIFRWGFISWDNSPRKWRDSLIVTKSTPERFKKYFGEHYKNAILKGNKYIFLNAWNEWAEGAYLEPDKENGYWYLEAINTVRKNYDSYINHNNNI